jgi:hypothetical protein
MMQTIEAVIDEKGRVHLLESVELKNVRRAFVTLLPAQVENELSGSLQNLGEILNDDLESASGEITEKFKIALEKSAKELAD